MRLLIITQVVDLDHPVLGFFHRWLEEFAGHYQSVVVVCLQAGRYSLPANVRLLSLGKESGSSRLKYLWRFYKYLWQERANYDAVFVHMNQEYVLLAGWWWYLMGKKIYFWRNHRYGNSLTWLAVFWAQQVFCTSDQSFTARFKKTRLMPAGVDTKMFSPDPRGKTTDRSILVLGRLSPVKRLEVFITALLELKKRHSSFTAGVVGSATSLADRAYQSTLGQLAAPLVADQSLTFYPGVVYSTTPTLYRQHQVYVNLTPAGSFDKTVLEAMACQCFVLLANPAFSDLVPATDQSLIFLDSTEPKILADKIEAIFSLAEERRQLITQTIRQQLLKKHSLERLMTEFFSLIQ